MALFERLLPRHLQIIYEINQRFLRQVQHALAGRRRAAGAHVASSRRAAASRCAWRTWRRSARTASTAWPSCTPSCSSATLLPDFYELWPERFNNKTNGVTPRRWLLHANPRLTRADHRAHRLGLDRPRPGPAAAAARRSPTTTTCSTACTRSSSANKRDAGRAGARAHAASSCSTRRDVRRAGQADPRVQAPAAQRACRSSRTTCALKRDPGRATRVPRTYMFAGKAAPGYHDGQAAHPADQRRRGGGQRRPRRARAGWRVAFVPNYGVSLARGDHPGRRPVGADLDGRQGGLGHQQHEVRAQRRADHRHAGRRQRRDPRRGRATTTSSCSA